MMDYADIQFSARAHLKTLVAADSGTTTLGASSTGFTRDSGSWLNDGFAPGMEVTSTGFPTVLSGVVRTVSATLLGVSGLTTAAAASGRRVYAGLPTQRSWENEEFEPTQGQPWVREQLLPGPTRQTGVGPMGSVELDPLYVVEIHTPKGIGALALRRYASAVMTLFTHRTAIPMANGDDLRVRTGTGPFQGQLLNRIPGWATVPVTVPLRVYTHNTI